MLPWRAQPQMYKKKKKNPHQPNPTPQKQKQERVPFRVMVLHTPNHKQFWNLYTIEREQRLA